MNKVLLLKYCMLREEQVVSNASSFKAMKFTNAT